MSDPRTSLLAAVPQRLTLSSPDAFLAAVPHLLGFPPRESVVLVGLADDGSGRESIRITQRFDTPSEALTDSDLAEVAEAAVAPMRASGSTTVIVAVFGDQNPAHAGLLPSTRLVDGLVDQLDESGMWVKDVLYTDGASRWSYGCETASCCPIEGTPISDELRTMIAAEFAVTGAAMAPSRQVLVDEVASDPARVGEVAVHLGATQVGDADVEAWRDAAIEQIAGLRSNPSPPPQTLAHVLAGLSDIRVRDTALWELTHDGTGRAEVISALTMAVRSAPQGHVAPAATALAIQHWTHGDGARANACLDRAVGDDPEYSLAQMVGTAIGRGLPPSSWTGVMHQLDRQVCRHGGPVPAPSGRTVQEPSIASPAPSLAS